MINHTLNYIQLTVYSQLYTILLTEINMDLLNNPKEKSYFHFGFIVEAT